jgi:hypothetical protein
MLLPTHLVTGQTAFLLASVATGHPPTLTEAAVALLAAALPDLDSWHSYTGRLVPFISLPLENLFGHRTLIHSLLAQAGIGALAYVSLPFGYFLAILSGWVSHSLADMLTPGRGLLVLAQPGALAQSLAPLQATGQVYLLGSLNARQIPSLPPMVEVTGERVSLHTVRIKRRLLPMP